MSDIQSVLAERVIANLQKEFSILQLRLAESEAKNELYKESLVATEQKLTGIEAELIKLKKKDDKKMKENAVEKVVK